MAEEVNSESSINRRNLLRLSGYSLGGMLVGGSVLTLAESLAGKATEPLNQKMEELLLKPQTPVPEFSVSQVEPNALIVNTYDFTPAINLNDFRLVVDGEVNNPLSLDLTAIQKMPRKSMVIRHVCVEGWAAIVQWAGVPLRELIQLAQPKPGVKYAYFISADRYYESWDLASCLHPQTMLAYEKNGAPLPIDHGAPLRLASPIKLGYKLSKWVIQVTLVSNLLPRRGFWEDQSYEWFAGL
ncbi:molybdopterin-dependent oxidoreductase [Phormidium sp. CLA17]|uniref:molybdopterin-dependent oxidoreductase n=1 Tax=Leptolyngbya sp. Cla-17 TaxID=2803751 RepID=UPI0014917543|nr:molybdopterin-dependent oxidoreductase [Leptolyngbya sp. Cla-17]MBM0742960.1 molybdopterin-dependent oxidoreductase [Leptolyngbya sp. Cla-17]